MLTHNYYLTLIFLNLEGVVSLRGHASDTLLRLAFRY